MATNLTNNTDLYVDGSGDDEINALGGGDIVGGGGGDDSINGGSGDDVLVGGAGLDTLNGGSGNDTANYQYADQGVFVYLYEGSAKVDYDTDRDVLTSIENLTGSNYRDTLVGNYQANVIYGMQGNDSLHGEAGNDRLYGGEGRETLYGGAGADTIDGGTGVDEASYILAGSGVTVSLLSGAGSRGEALGDKIVNVENLTGSNYDDELTGSGEANLIIAQQGDDAAYGLAGNDTIYGMDGNDTLSGGSDDDWLTGGAGADLYDGGAGTDSVNLLNGGVDMQIDLATGTGKGGEAEGDTYTGIENIYASYGKDTLIGNAAGNLLSGNSGNDVIDGADGADQLLGAFGQDSISGGGGNDTIVGGADRDIMRGQAGDDTFVFNHESESGTSLETRDIIKGFATGHDIIDLSKIDAMTSQVGNDAFHWIGAAAFGGSEGELHFHFAGDKTFVEADIDGNGAADFSIRFDNHLNFSSDNFIL